MTGQTHIHRDHSPAEATCQHCEQEVAWSYALRAFVHLETGIQACSTEGPQHGDVLYRRQR